MDFRYDTADELRHYGVIGMKWGVRRGNVSKAYAKASKKLDRLDSKLSKKESKAVKRSNKADKKYSSVLATDKSRAKAEVKARKSAAKLAKQARKADKWYKSMQKTFANTTVKLTPEQKAMGKRYEEMLRSRSLGRY